MQHILEADWKRIRDLKPEKLNMACGRIIAELQPKLAQSAGREHEIYLEMWRLIKLRDDGIALMFDGLKRSNALSKLIAWRCHGLVDDDELAQFSDETQRMVRGYVNGM